MIQKYINWILAGAVIILGLSQWRSCEASKLAGTLSAEKKVIQHQKDSLEGYQTHVILEDSALRLEKRLDSLKFNNVIDSLKNQQKVTQNRYQVIKGQLQKTVSALSNTVYSGTDTGLIRELQDLKAQLNNANDAVMSLQTNTGAQDSVMTAELSYRDSVIAEKDKTIDELKANNLGMVMLIDRANHDLSEAIKEIQKGKRRNFVRTIAEALLVIGLLFKK